MKKSELKTCPNQIWFDVITIEDARALKKWWYDHTIDEFFIEKSEVNPRYYRLMRVKAKDKWTQR